MRSTSEPARLPLAAAACAFAVSLACYWPGVAMYDTVAQYGQVLAGTYEDWHPPIMARLWALLAPLGGGAAPMLVLQLAGYWAGLGLLGAGAAHGRGARVGVGLVAIGALPVFLGWQGVVLKDAQMAGAMLAAVGTVAWFRLRQRRVPIAAVVAIVVLLAYATLVRANAVFAAVPLGILLATPRRTAITRAALIAAGTLTALAAAPLINHRLLGATATGVEKTQALYDLAGIAVHVDDPAGALNAGEVAALRGRRCVRPFFWDPLGDPSRCDTIVARLRQETSGQLYVTLATAVLAHPLAYAGHRLAHLNSTERWLVPFRWTSAAPPATNEPNDLGLEPPGKAAVLVQRAARGLVETPLGWPFAWAIVAATLLAGLRRAGGAGRDVAVALLVSALTLEASFAIVSIASDLRYHLWPMIATAVAVGFAGRDAHRRTVLAGGAVLALMLVAALVARATLPVSPQSYAGMLG